MKAQTTIIVILALTLSACGGTEGRFRLKGSFEHLEQGEFYVFSTDGGTTSFDTVAVQKGHFTYDVPLAAPATFHLLYPNLSELIIFGEPGEAVNVKGDAQDLQSVRVKGTKANEALTRFRLDNLNKPLNQKQEAAETFISENPASPAALYLFKEYFLTQETADNAKLHRLYSALCEAQPDNLQLRVWQSDLMHRARTPLKGDTLPDFRLALRDSTDFCRNDCNGRPLLINFWASWESRSVADMFQMKKLTKLKGDSINVLSISLDMSPSSLKGIEKIDTVTWPSYCDFKAWNSPAVQLFGIRSVPFFILTDSTGHVILTATSFHKEVEPELKKLFYYGN